MKSNLLGELDPRMKLVLLVMFTTATYITKDVRILVWDYFLIILLYLLRGLWKGATKTSFLFCAFLMIEFLLRFIPHQGIRAALGLIVFFLERTSIFFVMGNWMSAKLRISDFVTAMQNMHIPKGVIVTLAVVFRYLPTVSDEFLSIRNTMKLRDIGINFKNILLHPLNTCEYAIVPLIIRSMTIADELAASAMTRGLDLETDRTSYREVHLRQKDILATALVIAAVAGGLTFNKFT
ncbi:MAG: energy-coupling factor transporter transmembrane component T [Lachnospiraceae bacterium]